MSETRLCKVRRSRRLTQTQVAEAIAISVEKLARIEAGTDLCRLDVAARMSKVLGVSLSKLFPGSTRVLSALPKDRHPSDDQVVTLSKFGLDVDPAYWSAKLLLRSGVECRIEIDGPAVVQMFAAVQRGSVDEKFLFLTAEGWWWIVNLDHMIVCQLLFEGYDDRIAGDQATGVRVQLADGSYALYFDVEADYPLTGDDDGDIGQLAHLVQMAELWQGPEPFVAHFTDYDGEEVFLRMDDVATLSFPASLINPGCAPEDDDCPEIQQAPDPPHHSPAQTAQAAGTIGRSTRQRP